VIPYYLYLYCPTSYQNFGNPGYQYVYKWTQELERYLETRRENLSEKEFLALIVDMLEKDPPEDTRDILRAWLLAFSYINEDRVARYCASFLSDPDPFQREIAALQLATIVSEPNSLADKMLTDYLGEEARVATIEEKLDIIMRRFRELFPGQDNEEDQAR